MASTNTLFAVIAVEKPAELAERLDTVKPWLSFKAAESEWFVIAPASVLVKEVSDKLGITGGEVSTGIVLRVENYFGRTSTTTWEWITAKMGVALDDA